MMLAKHQVPKSDTSNRTPKWIPVSLAVTMIGGAAGYGRLQRSVEDNERSVRAVETSMQTLGRSDAEFRERVIADLAAIKTILKHNQTTAGVP